MCVCVLQVICNNAQDIKCSGLQKITVPYKMLSVAVSRAKLLNHSCFSLNLAIYGESHWNYVHSVLILFSVVDES